MSIANKPTDKWKICIDCGQDAPHPWYNVKKHRNGGQFASYCRRCLNRRKREKEKRNGTERDFLALFEKQKRQQKEQILKRKCIALLGGKCEDCGLEDDCPSVYDFHHTDPTKKEANINSLIRKRRWAPIEAELKKCQLLCSNCHRRKHSNYKCCKRKKPPK